MRKQVLRLVFAQVFLHACMTGLRMAAPLMLLRAGETEAAVGVLLALFALSQVFLALPAGQMVERVGLKTCFGVAAAVSCTGTLLAAVWPLTSVLYLAALCAGAACGLVVITLQRHVGRLTDDADELREAFSWLSIGPAVSNFIGPLCAGVMIDAYGFRAAFLTVAFFPFVGWWLLRGLADHRLTHAQTPPTTESAWSLLRFAPMRRLLWVNWFLSSSWDAHTFMVPILGHERGISASAIGMVLGFFALAAAASRLAMPFVSRRFTERQIIVVSMLCTGVALGLYPFSNTAFLMAANSLVLGLFLGSVQPMIMSALHQVTPQERHSQALALRLMTINACSVGMPLIFGAASAALGASAVFWIVASAMTMGSRLAMQIGEPH